MFELTSLEGGLLFAFIFCALTVVGMVGWLTLRRLHERSLFRRAVKAARREDHAGAMRRLAAAERCWLPATLHPTAGNCQQSLEEYAEIVALLGEVARQLGTSLETEPMEELVQRRITMVNRELFQDNPANEVESLEEAFKQERMRLQRACDEVFAPPASSVTKEHSEG